MHVVGQRQGKVVFFALSRHSQRCRLNAGLAVEHGAGFDAANMILAAIESTALVNEGTVQVGGQALRDALFATVGLAGATGTITCDAYGDCGVPQFIVWTVENGMFVPVGP